MNRIWRTSLLAIFALAASALADDVIFYAPFDGSPDAATAAGDKQAVYAKAPAYCQGIKGQALAMQFESIAYATKGNILVDQGTLTCWLKPTASWQKSKDYNWFFTAGEWKKSGLIYLYYCGDPINGPRFMLGKSSEANWGINAPKMEWTVDQWHFFACTWTAAGSRIALYVDGKLSSELALGGDNFPKDVGNEIHLSSAVPTAMDELTIYNRALTAEEIGKKYEELKPAAEAPKAK